MLHASVLMTERYDAFSEFISIEIVFVFIENCSKTKTTVFVYIQEIMADSFVKQCSSRLHKINVSIPIAYVAK